MGWHIIAVLRHPNTAAEIVRALGNNAGTRDVYHFKCTAKLLFKVFDGIDQSLECWTLGAPTIGHKVRDQVVREIKECSLVGPLIRAT